MKAILEEKRRQAAQESKLEHTPPMWDLYVLQGSRWHRRARFLRKQRALEALDRWREYRVAELLAEPHFRTGGAKGIKLPP